MRNIITILLTALTFCSFSQTLKTFNGPFNDGKSQNGTAVYTYYEDPVTREYVKQGAFKYTFIGKGGYNGYNQTITGSFEKGLRNGIWTYKITMIDFGTNNPFTTGTVSLVANYKNGYADGNWKEVNSYKTRNKYYNYGQYTWEAYGPVKTTTIDFNFKNGYFVGSCNINDEFAKYKISGNFNDSSFFTDTWVANESNNNYVEVFKDNFYYECVIRNNNGELLKLEKYHEDYDLFIKAKPMSNDERTDAGVEIVTKCGLSAIKDYFPKLFQNEYFLYEEIGGDLSFKEGFKGGCQYNLVKKQYESILTNKFYLKAEVCYKNNQLKDAMYAYNHILQNNYNIKPSERKMVENKYIEVKTKFLEEVKPFVENNKYFKEYLKLQEDSLGKDFEIKSKEYNLGNNVSHCWRENTWENAKKCLNEYISQILNEPFKLYYFEYYFKYKLTINAEEELCRAWTDQIDTLKLRYTYRDKAEFQKNMDNAKNNYLMAISIKELYLTAINNKNKIETLNTQNKKKALFAKYTLVLQEYTVKYNTYPKLDECYKLLNELKDISNKVIALYTVESKDIEKQIKNAETTEQIKSILLGK
ncbi:MAG: hypothetical protein ACOYMA_19595 [Bacteroidia bacterium]